MLDDLPQGRKSHASPIRTCPRDSSVGAERFKVLLAAAQICKQTENWCIIVRYIGCIGQGQFVQAVLKA